MLSLEYMAGFFDGEGTATIVLNPNKSVYGFRWLPMILITQKNPMILKEVRDTLNMGNVYKMGKADMHQLRITKKDDIRRFLDLFRALVVVKLPQLALIEQALDLMRGQGNQTLRDDALSMLDIVDRLRLIQIRKNKYTVITEEYRKRILESGLDRNLLYPETRKPRPIGMKYNMNR